MPTAARMSASAASDPSSVACARCLATASPRTSSSVRNFANGNCGSTACTARCMSAATPACAPAVRTIQLGENHVWTIWKKPPDICAAGTYAAGIAPTGPKLPHPAFCWMSPTIPTMVRGPLMHLPADRILIGRIALHERLIDDDRPAPAALSASVNTRPRSIGMRSVSK